MRQFNPETYLSMKAAFRGLVRAAGGQSSATALTRGCQPQMSKAMSPNDMDHFPALDQIADLEAETGSTPVTKLLADLAGFDLVPRSEIARPETLMTFLAAMSLEAGSFQSGLIKALDDGRIDDAERASLVSALDGLDGVLKSIRFKLKPAIRAVPGVAS